MASCKDCIHERVCEKLCPKGLLPYQSSEYPAELFCLEFKNKADVVEVETIKSWLYSIAINNVNNNGDFSDACEEIISRLDGLRRFTKERSSNE